MNVANDLVHGDDCANTWVTETARRPIAFAQVREDALLDQWVVDRLPSGAHILMVASGGCTAAMLASMVVYSSLKKKDEEVRKALAGTMPIVVAAHDIAVGAKIDAGAIKLTAGAVRSTFTKNGSEIWLVWPLKVAVPVKASLPGLS